MMKEASSQLPTPPTEQTPVSTPAPATFSEFDLPEPLMRAISDLGFTHCTPIQQEVLKHTLQGEDAIGRAQTGTGKTAAFLISIITDLLTHPLTDTVYAGEPRALIVAPTRELVLQIGKDAQQLCKYLDLKIATVVGGMDYQKQQNQLQSQKIDILVATPGRLLDFLNQKVVWLDRVEILVLDEADRMLDMGFIPDVKRIIRATPKKEHRQTLLFSATFSEDIMNLAKSWTWDAAVVEIEPESVTTETVEQHLYMTSGDEKFTVLYNLIQQSPGEKIIVFGNRRNETRRLMETLTRRKISCDLLSGEVPQKKRLRILDDFKQGKIQVLVATDVAGRGIHVDNVRYVVNFNLPEDPEDYVHRIGRTGRAGESGTAISFACEDDAFLVPELEEAIGRKFDIEYPPENLLTPIPG